MPTIYVTKAGTQVRKVGERLVLTQGQDVLEEIPLVHVDRLVLVGRGVGMTTAAMFALTRKGVDIVYLTGSGRYVSRVSGPEHKHSRLRFAQALFTADAGKALGVARAIVLGKVNNQRALVRRNAHGAGWAAPELAGMDAMQKRVESAGNADELRGLEGMAAKNYFSIFRRLLAPPPGGGGWGFERRAYYPPTDPINALLSFGYTLLLNDMIAACQMIGLDPYLGCFHAVDYGRPSMALDLVEEFRPVIVDSLVLQVVNRRMISPRDFRGAPAGEADGEDDEEEQPSRSDRPGQGVYLTDEWRKRWVQLYEERVNEVVAYPLPGERTSYRRIFSRQAESMARLVTGEAASYTPLLAR